MGAATIAYLYEDGGDDDAPRRRRRRARRWPALSFLLVLFFIHSSRLNGRHVE